MTLSIDASNLTGWLTGQRWFGSKARELSAVNLLEVLPLREGDQPLILALVEARFQTGVHELYQLILGGRRGGDGPAGGELIAAEGGWELFDAVEDPLIVELLDREAVVEGERGRLTFHRTPGFTPIATARSRPMGVEQSNSSIVLDERLVMKVFRRLEAGDNPELEMLRYLTDAGFEHIARLDGWYVYTGELMDATLGVMQDYIEGARDGWGIVLDGIVAGDDGVIELLAELGRVTGSMHRALGSTMDPDFAPEEASDEALSLVTATIDEQIERTFVDLPPDLPALEPIRHRGQEVRDRLQLMSHIGVGGRLIREHGDFHLGQTLLGTEGRWIIIDFEGEPARPLLDRRRKRSPLRDVAGMLRSFAYAASAAELLRDTPAPPDWEARARQAFLEGYLETVDPALLPAGRAATEKLLAIFELEKAVYELRYELNNRPDWAAIPVAGIARLLEEPLPA